MLEVSCLQVAPSTRNYTVFNSNVNSPYAFKKRQKQGWREGSAGKVLATQARGSSSSPETQIKMLGVVMHTYNPSAGKDGESLELTGQATSPDWRAPGTHMCPHPSTHIHTNTHTYMKEGREGGRREEERKRGKGKGREKRRERQRPRQTDRHRDKPTKFKIVPTWGGQTGVK